MVTQGTYRAGIEARLAALEAKAHEHTARRPFYAHLPWLNPDGTGIPRTEWPAMLRDRPWCTGMFGYSSGPLVTAQWWHMLTGEWDLLLSPKSLDGLDAFLEQVPDAARARLTVAFYQEPEDDFTDESTLRYRTLKHLYDRPRNDPDREDARWEWLMSTEATRADYRAKVTECGTICHAHGVRNVAELNGYVTHADTHGGIAAQVEMVPVEAVDGIAWSAFDPHGDGLAAQVLLSVRAAHDEHWPGLPLMFVAGSVGVPVGTPDDSPLRVRRVPLVTELLMVAGEVGSTTLGFYDVPTFPGGPDYGADQYVTPVLHAAATA